MCLPSCLKLPSYEFKNGSILNVLLLTSISYRIHLSGMRTHDLHSWFDSRDHRADFSETRPDKRCLTIFIYFTRTWFNFFSSDYVFDEERQSGNNFDNFDDNRCNQLRTKNLKKERSSSVPSVWGWSELAWLIKWMEKSACKLVDLCRRVCKRVCAS